MLGILLFPYFKFISLFQHIPISGVTLVQFDKLLCWPHTVLRLILHVSLNAMISILRALMFCQVVRACTFVVSLCLLFVSIVGTIYMVTLAFVLRGKVNEPPHL